MTANEPLSAEHPHALCAREAVVSTFAMFCGDTPRFLGTQDDPGAAGDGEACVVGIISLVAAKPWTLMLALPQPTAEALAQAFIGFEIAFDSDDMGDVVGEMANILSGSVVARLEGIGISTEMSLPTVMRGNSLTLLQQEGMTTLPLAFETPQGPFVVNLVAGAPHRLPTRLPGRA